MRPPDPELPAIAGRLQGWVSQGRYREAQSCFEEYCQALQETLQQMARGDPRIPQMEGEWRRLLAETRQRALIGRAHAAARLARLPRPGLFGGPAPPQHTFELLG